MREPTEPDNTFKFLYFCEQNLKISDAICSVVQKSSRHRSATIWSLVWSFPNLHPSLPPSLSFHSHHAPRTLSTFLVSFTIISHKMTSIGFLTSSPPSSSLHSALDSRRPALCGTRFHRIAPAIRMMADDKPKNPLSGLGMPHSSIFFYITPHPP